MRKHANTIAFCVVFAIASITDLGQLLALVGYSGFPGLKIEGISGVMWAQTAPPTGSHPDQPANASRPAHSETTPQTSSRRSVVVNSFVPQNSNPQAAPVPAPVVAPGPTAVSSRRSSTTFRANPFVTQLVPATTQPPLAPVASDPPALESALKPLASAETSSLAPQSPLADSATVPLNPPLTDFATANLVPPLLPPVVNGADLANPLLPIAPIVTSQSVSTAVPSESTNMAILSPLPPIVSAETSLMSAANLPKADVKSPEASSAMADSVVLEPLPQPQVVIVPANTTRRRKLIDLNDFLVAPVTDAVPSDGGVGADDERDSIVDHQERPLVNLDQFLVQPEPRSVAVPKRTGPVPVTVRRESRPRPVFRVQDEGANTQQRRENYMNDLKRNLNQMPLQKAMDYELKDAAADVDQSNNYLLHFDGFAVLPTQGHGVRSGSFGQLWDGKLSNWQSPNVRHQPLYFEQPNLERYGVESRFPVVQSGVHFFSSTIFLPYQMVAEHPLCPDYPIGLDRPGNCTTPYGFRPPLNPRAMSFQSLFTAGAIFAL